MKKETRGRKPVQDKKIQVTIYIPQSKVADHGGIKKTKEKAVQYLTASALILLCLFGENLINSIL